MVYDLNIRSHQPELMDTQTFSIPEMRKILSFLEFTNQFFGGYKVIIDKLEAWSKNWFPNQPVHILDVGTGGADIPIAISQWAEKKSMTVKITAIDSIPEVVQIAKENTEWYPNIEIQQKDVRELAKEEIKFDYVIGSLLLHHIAPNQNETVLKLFDSLAQRGVIISDLLRTQASYWSVKALSTLIGNKVVRYDGPLSVRRSFKVHELEWMAEKAHLPYLTAKRERWFRLSLSGEK